MRTFALCVAAVAALLAAAPAKADIRKIVHLCGEQGAQARLCPSFELALTPPAGWVQDKAATRANGVQVLVPQGRTFGNAEALIYVRVSLRENREQPLAEFVRVSQQRWRNAVPDTRIAGLADAARGAGKPPFLVFAYENPSRPQQAHERVAFGLDSDGDGNSYVLTVVMTGRSQKALERADAPYKAFLRAH